MELHRHTVACVAFDGWRILFGRRPVLNGAALGALPHRFAESQSEHRCTECLLESLRRVPTIRANFFEHIISVPLDRLQCAYGLALERLGVFVPCFVFIGVW